MKNDFPFFILVLTIRKMAGYGTKKPGGDVGVQLTFPTVFEDTFAALEPGNIAYANAARPAPKFLPAGDDLQALYHEQKRIDAHRRALNAVRDTAASHYRANHGHAGYYGLPPVILSQRRFANPSNGSGGIGGDLYPARRDASDAPFHCVRGGMVGGVLRSAQGQRYGVSKLRDRIRQLNNIDQAETAFKTLSVAEQSAAPVLMEERVTQGFEAPTGLTLEIISILDEIENSIADYQHKDVDRLAGRSGSEFLKLLLRYGATANREQLEALLEQLQYVVVGDRDGDSLIKSWAIDAAGDQGLASSKEVFNAFPFFGRLALDLTKAYLYIKAMLAKTDSSAAERKRASETVAKTLAIGTAKAGSEVSALLGRIFDSAEFGVPVEDADADLNGIPDAEQFDELVRGFYQPIVVREPPPETRGRGRGRARGGARQRKPTKRASDRFTPNAPTREDTLAREYGMAGARFDRDVRNAFGDRSGAYLGEPFVGSTPEEAPRNGMRKSKVENARLPVAPPTQAAPTMPDLPAAPVEDAAAAEGMGRRKGRGRKPKLPTKSVSGLTRATLPKDREGFVALAEDLRGKGHPIRVNKNSNLKSIRANFIRKFNL